MKTSIGRYSGCKFTPYQPIILYRKLTANYIFSGYEILPMPAVLITDESGKVIDLVEPSQAGDGIEYLEGILSPGFINAHCHLELSHLRSQIARHTGLVDFVSQIIATRQGANELIYEAIGHAEQEMINNGIVAVGDICNTDYTVPQKKKERLYYHNFIEVSGFPPSVADIRFSRIENLLHAFTAISSHNSIVPHAPYSVSEKLMQMVAGYPGNNLLTMHNQESAEENSLFTSGSGAFMELYRQLGIETGFFKAPGMSSLQYMLPMFKHFRPLILVHNVHTSAGDMDFAKKYFESEQQRLFFCLCPNANLYIGGELPNIKLMMEKGLNIVLGTDSLASNDQLDVYAEMKTLRTYFPDLPLATMLQWATSNGAEALGILDRYGSFGKGKKPGVLLLSADQVTRIL